MYLEMGTLLSGDTQPQSSAHSGSEEESVAVTGIYVCLLKKISEGGCRVVSLACVWDSWWTRQAEPGAPLLARKVPSGARAAGHLGSSSGGCPRRPRPPPSPFPPRPQWPWVPAVAPSCGPWLPSHAFPRQHTPGSPPFPTDSCPCFLPSRHRSELLPFFARDQSHSTEFLSSRRIAGSLLPAPPPALFCLLFSARVLFPTHCCPVLQTFQRVLLLPERALAASSSLWVGAGGGWISS